MNVDVDQAGNFFVHNDKERESLQVPQLVNAATMIQQQVITITEKLAREQWKAMMSESHDQFSWETPYDVADDVKEIIRKKLKPYRFSLHVNWSLEEQIYAWEVTRDGATWRNPQLENEDDDEQEDEELREEKGTK